jgi:hypothetical protein
MGTWELRDLLSGRKPIGCKWVYCSKQKQELMVTAYIKFALIEKIQKIDIITSCKHWHAPYDDIIGFVKIDKFDSFSSKKVDNWLRNVVIHDAS